MKMIEVRWWVPHSAVSICIFCEFADNLEKGLYSLCSVSADEMLRKKRPMYATKSLVIGVITLVVVVSVTAATIHFIAASGGLTSGGKHCRTNDPVVPFRTDVTPFTKAEVEQYINAYPFLTTSGKPGVVNEIV